MKHRHAFVTPGSSVGFDPPGMPNRCSRMPQRGNGWKNVKADGLGHANLFALIRQKNREHGPLRTSLPSAADVDRAPVFAHDPV